MREQARNSGPEEEIQLNGKNGENLREKETGWFRGADLMRKIRLGLLLLVLGFLFIQAAPAETLTMPSDLQIIEAQAFYGDRSLDTVVLNDQIREIRAGAFAGSSLKNINLPDSLTFIADDALPGPDQVELDVEEGGYPYNWAVSHGFLITPVQSASEAYMRTITVSWADEAEAQSYNVYYGTTDDISKATAVTGITGTSHTIENLQAGTVYYTWVRAVRTGGVTKASNMQQIITYPAAPVLNSHTVSGNTITLGWDAVPGANIYRVCYSTTDQYGTASRITNIRATTYTLRGLEFNQAYYIWMESANESGGMRTTDSVEVITGDDALTPKQSDPKGGQRKVTANWSAVDNAEGYNVYYGTSAGFASATKVSNVTPTVGTDGILSYEINNLTAGTTYFTWVSAINGGTESEPSNRKSTITLPTATELNTPEVNGNTVKFSWAASTGATGYRLRFGTSSVYSEATRQTSVIKGTACTIKDLNYNTTYYFWIISINASGSIVRTQSSQTVVIGPEEE